MNFCQFESVEQYVEQYLEQYVGSAVKFKTRFHIHKSDIKTKKERCGPICSGPTYRTDRE